MDLLPSLCAAMMRTGGDSLILREGSPPHVMAGMKRYDVARAVLSHNAVEALLLQIFSDASRRTFQETGYVVELVRVAEPALVVTAKAEREDDQLRIELVRQLEEALRDVPDEFAPELHLEPADAESEEETAVEPVPTPQELALEPANLELAVPALEAPEARSRSLGEPPRDWASVLAQAPLAESSQDAAPKGPVSASGSAADGLVAGTAWQDRTALIPLTERAAKMGASTLFLRAGAPVMARVDGKMVHVQSAMLSAETFAGVCAELKGDANEYWRPAADGSWTHEDARTGRLTCRTFADDLGSGLVVFLDTPTPALSLHRLIPRKVKSACDGDGLLVVSASTSADVLAVGAATADWAAQRRGGYVIALRPAGTPRPVIAGDFVSQRVVAGSDADVAAAIRAAVAESPDVLLVIAGPSELSVREVIHAADGGRLVVVAMLAQTSIQALRLLAGRLQGGGNAPDRLALAACFRAAFSHRVVRRLHGGQTLVQDLILGTSDVSAFLASGDLAGVTRLQRIGAAGMSTVDATLARAVARGHLSLRQAAAQAVDRAHLIASVRNARRARRTSAAVQGSSVPPSHGASDIHVPVGTGSDVSRQPESAR
jgi:Tfp pilus assembly pilus retraction ATPase PilT